MKVADIDKGALVEALLAAKQNPIRMESAIRRLEEGEFDIEPADPAGKKPKSST